MPAAGSTAATAPRALPAIGACRVAWVCSFDFEAKKPNSKRGKEPQIHPRGRRVCSVCLKCFRGALRVWMAPRLVALHLPRGLRGQRLALLARITAGGGSVPRGGQCRAGTDLRSMGEGGCWDDIWLNIPLK